MPDHETAPHPTDQAYAQAEAKLHDEAARAARRSRVLDAISSEPAPVQVSKPRLAWGRGGWLAAASVAGLSALVAVQYFDPGENQPAETATSPAAVAPDRALDPAPSTPAPTNPPGEPPTATTRPPVSPRAEPVAPEAQAAKPAPAMRVEPAPPPPPPAPAVSERLSDLADAEIQAAPAPRAEQAAESRRSAFGAARSAAPPNTAQRLRAAAAKGDTAELSSLLARDGRVDEQDGDGETALMKAVAANQPAAAALLLRNGASLDLEDHAGVSARDRALAADEPQLNRALGLDR